MAATTEAAKRKSVVEAIDRVLFTINELEAILGEFNGQNELLHAKLNEYIEELGKLEGVKDNMVGGGLPVELAVELLRAVDEGTNPDTFTVQVFRDSLAQNQASKGKVEAFRQLRQRTTEQLQQAFPAAVSDYQALRQQPAASGGAAEAAAAAAVPAEAGQAAGPAPAAGNPS
ncbi:hypothetical protein ABPG77_000013 [Micractinium sp. CCAP 211/92]